LALSESSSGHSVVVSGESARKASFAVFRTVLSAYIVDKKQLSAVRRELTRCVAASHDRTVSMLHYLRAANRTGLLTDETMRILVADIQASVDAADERSPGSGAQTDADRGTGSAERMKSPSRTLLDGRYEICQRVGKGGIGEVFLARDLHRIATGCDDPRVAIKVIQQQHSDCPDAIRSLQREAVNAQCLVHRGIRRVYDLERHRQQFFLVMEWLDGETLAARLDRTKGRPMAVDAFRSVLSQVTSALSFAHRHGIVHGDIKPGNVFMTVRGEIKLLDFGHTEGITSLTRPGAYAITCGYSSLEVYRGAQAEIQDDVYSLSVMAYRMLVGRRPFGRHTAVEVASRGLQPDRPASLSSRQWQTLQSGLALHREHRPATVRELCDGLLSSSSEQNRRPHMVVAA
jgi:serine/threonine protein kinase